MSTSGGNDEAVRSSHSVTNAWERWIAGDADAQFDLMDLLRGLMVELFRYVQKNRGAKFQAVIDSEGVLNEALGRLLIKAQAGEIADIRNRSDLRGKLYVVVKYVLSDEKGAYSTSRRDGGEFHNIELIKKLAGKSTADPGEDFLEEITGRFAEFTKTQ